MFAAPFLAAMDDHSDGVTCSALNPVSLVSFVSGAADGEVMVWDLPTRKALWSVYAHAGFVRGLSVSNDGSYFFSCGDDKTVKQWRMAAHDSMALEDAEDGVGMGRRRGGVHGGGGAAAGVGSSSSSSSSSGASIKPVTVWQSPRPFMSIDHHWRTPTFATSSSVVEVWDYARSEPTHTYEWGADTITSVRFNPAEASLLATTANDRSVCLYDLRMDSPLRKVVHAMTCNALAWNPREPFNYTVACEDSNAYTFDMRKLDVALMVHRDHVGAVLDVSYSPTGKEFATASYDRTVRLWRVDQGKSREVYHTKRMQRVFTVKWTGDARYVLSGSDDANIRLWKARASEKIGRLLPRERAAMDYAASLKKKFAHLPEVRRIATHRHVPKNILRAKEARLVEENKERRKLGNVRAHSRPGSGAGVPEAARKKGVVGVLK
jgi:WD repeat and SOF domain-containing protein 1